MSEFLANATEFVGVVIQSPFIVFCIILFFAAAYVADRNER